MRTFYLAAEWSERTNGRSHGARLGPCPAYASNVDHLLALGGTGAGILLATLLIRWFRSVNPVELPPGNAVSLSLPVLLFAATLGGGSVLIFGLFPAWRSSEVDLNAALKDRERGAGAGDERKEHVARAGRADRALIDALCRGWITCGQSMANGIDPSGISHGPYTDGHSRAA